MDRIVSWAKDQEAVRGLFIAGSIAQGTADVYSDLDLVAIADRDAIEALLESACAIIDAAEPVVIEHRLGPETRRILSLVTDKWHRIDFAFGTPDSDALNQPLVPVLDPEALFKGAPEKTPPAPVAAGRVIGLATEFYRILGLSVVVRGREDPHVAHDGANILRNLLIELFLLEPPVRTRSGAKKLLPILTDEQQTILKSLPPLADDFEVLAVFNESVAGVFVPRARKLIESLGGTWPAAVEQATRTYLRRLER